MNPIRVAVDSAHKHKKSAVVRKAPAFKAVAKVLQDNAMSFCSKVPSLRKQCDTSLVHKPGCVQLILSFSYLVAMRATRPRYKGDIMYAC